MARNQTIIAMLLCSSLTAASAAQGAGDQYQSHFLSDFGGCHAERLAQGEYQRQNAPRDAEWVAASIFFAAHVQRCNLPGQEVQRILSEVLESGIAVEPYRLGPDPETHSARHGEMTRLRRNVTLISSRLIELSVVADANGDRDRAVRLMSQARTTLETARERIDQALDDFQMEDWVLPAPPGVVFSRRDDPFAAYLASRETELTEEEFRSTYVPQVTGGIDATLEVVELLGPMIEGPPDRQAAYDSLVLLFERDPVIDGNRTARRMKLPAVVIEYAITFARRHGFDEVASALRYNQARGAIESTGNERQLRRQYGPLVESADRVGDHMRTEVRNVQASRPGVDIVRRVNSRRCPSASRERMDLAEPPFGGLDQAFHFDDEGLYSRAPSTWASGSDRVAIGRRHEFKTMTDVMLDDSIWVDRYVDGRWQGAVYAGVEHGEPFTFGADPSVSICRNGVVLSGERLNRRQGSYGPVGLEDGPLNISLSWADLQRDSDSDGITDMYEARLGLNLQDSDTDGDGVADGLDGLPTINPDRDRGEESLPPIAAAAVIEALTQPEIVTPPYWIETLHIVRTDPPEFRTLKDAPVFPVRRLGEGEVPDFRLSPVYLRADRALFANLSGFDRPVIVLRGVEHRALERRYGAHMPVRLFVEASPSGDEWLVRWHQEDRRGAFLIKLDGDEARSEFISVTRTPIMPG